MVVPSGCKLALYTASRKEERRHDEGRTTCVRERMIKAEVQKRSDDGEENFREKQREKIGRNGKKSYPAEKMSRHL